MVFRRLSLKALLCKSPNEIHASQIAGFYVSCSSDLRNRLGWLKSEQAANRFRNEVIHYFNLLVAREIVQTMAAVAIREDRQTLFGFGVAEEAALTRVSDGTDPGFRDRATTASRDEPYAARPRASSSRK